MIKNGFKKNHHILQTNDIKSQRTVSNDKKQKKRKENGTLEDSQLQKQTRVRSITGKENNYIFKMYNFTLYIK